MTISITPDYDESHNITLSKVDAIPKFDPFEEMCLLQKKWKNLINYTGKRKIKSRIQDALEPRR